MAVEKTIQTLGDSLTAEAKRLGARHRTAIAWLDALQPVLQRAAKLGERPRRFERREAPLAKATPPASWAPPAPDDAEGLHGEADDTGVAVPPAARHHLQPLIGPNIDRARIRTGARSDAFARALGADAVSVDRDIHFRAGAFAPDTPRGLGLLAHELTHVVESARPGVAERRSNAAGVRDEERRADHAEQGARRAVSPLAAQAFPSLAPQKAALAPSAAPVGPDPRGGASRPMRADADRPAELPPPATAEPNLDKLKQSVYRDVMARLRVEFERGA